MQGFVNVMLSPSRPIVLEFFIFIFFGIIRHPPSVIPAGVFVKPRISLERYNLVSYLNVISDSISRQGLTKLLLIYSILANDRHFEEMSRF